MSVYLGTQKVQVYAGADAVRVFAGRPDYLILRGKLVWADPKIYLQSSGTQYLETGIYGTGKTTLDFSYQFLNSSVALFGARRGFGDNSLSLFKESGANKARFDYAGYGYITNSGGSWGLYQNGVFHSHLTQDNTYYFEVTDRTTGDTRYASAAVGTAWSTPYTMALFARNSNGTIDNFCQAKIYYFKIYEDNVLTRHFVPVPSGLVIGSTTISANCLFDIVSQTPYYNAGSGAFTYGKDN